MSKKVTCVPYVDHMYFAPCGSHAKYLADFRFSCDSHGVFTCVFVVKIRSSCTSITKLAAPVIATSLTKLINTCIPTAVFPSAWKLARITPLHKTGGKSDKNNYRPISVLSILPKVFERDIYDCTHSFFKENNVLYQFQSGFRRHHSTETALINIYYTCTRDLKHSTENNRLQLNVGKTKTMLITGKRLKKTFP